MAEISTPISFGELIDKITILEIKSERISAADKLKNVRHELDVLTTLWNQHDAAQTDISTQRQQLKSINEALWEIEDDIRLKEKAQEFDQAFIKLARDVYFTNDKRAAVKKEINLLLGSDLIEEKSYEDYSNQSA